MAISDINRMNPVVSEGASFCNAGWQMMSERALFRLFSNFSSGLSCDCWLEILDEFTAANGALCD